MLGERTEGQYGPVADYVVKETKVGGKVYMNIVQDSQDAIRFDAKNAAKLEPLIAAGVLPEPPAWQPLPPKNEQQVLPRAAGNPLQKMYLEFPTFVEKDRIRGK